MPFRRVKSLCAVALLSALPACGGGSGGDTLADAEATELVSRTAAVVAAPPPGAAASTGELLFGRIGCNGCHTIDGVGGMVGPNLSAVGARPSRDLTRWPTTEAYIRASLETPGAFVADGFGPAMPPPEQLGITPEDIGALVSYLLAQTD
ncbi:MAG: cytochrome c [Gemmatimonadota bacterium]